MSRSVLLAAINVADSLTGLGTFLLGLCAVAGIIDQRHRSRRVEGKTDRIQTAVNGNTAADRSYIAELTKTLNANGIKVPPPPVPEAE